MHHNSIVNTNLDKHHCSLSCQSMKTIAKPLFDIGINFFAYSNYHSNCEESYLSTDPRIMKLYTDNQYYKHMLAGNLENYYPCSTFFSELDQGDKLIRQYITQVHTLLGSKEGIAIVHTEAEAVHIYYFTGINDSPSFFLNQMMFLQNFIQYFHETGSELIKAAYDHRIYYPNTADNSILTSGQINRTNNVTYTPYGLSKREKECLTYIQSGFSCKLVANALKISPRTAEKHIKSIKIKTHSKTLPEAIYKLNNFKKNTLQDSKNSLH